MNFELDNYEIFGKNVPVISSKDSNYGQIKLDNDMVFSFLESKKSKGLKGVLHGDFLQETEKDQKIFRRVMNGLNLKITDSEVLGKEFLYSQDDWTFSNHYGEPTNIDPMFPLKDSLFLGSVGLLYGTIFDISGIDPVITTVASTLAGIIVGGIAGLVSNEVEKNKSVNLNVTTRDFDEFLELYNGAESIPDQIAKIAYKESIKDSLASKYGAIKGEFGSIPLRKCVSLETTVDSKDKMKYFFENIYNRVVS